MLPYILPAVKLFAGWSLGLRGFSLCRLLKTSATAAAPGLTFCSRLAPHGQGNALALKVHFHDLDLYLLGNLDRIRGILHKGIRDLAHMDQTVLMHADIHKAAKGGD